MSAAVTTAIAHAQQRAGELDALAADALGEVARATSPLGALGAATDAAHHRHEAARWREVAAVLREVSGAT